MLNRYACFTSPAIHCYIYVDDIYGKAYVIYALHIYCDTWKLMEMKLLCVEQERYLLRNYFCK
jgi:hypothetical protein